MATIYSRQNNLNDNPEYINDGNVPFWWTEVCDN